LSPHGLQLYFYNEAAIDDEFGNYGNLEAIEIDEPKENGSNPSSWCRFTKHHYAVHQNG